MSSITHHFTCWENFRRGKRKRKDIQAFERHLEDHIFHLASELSSLSYQHDSYQNFHITDPKLRFISKATVRDRLVHEAVHSILYPIFDKKFIFHSLASRKGKGIHIGHNHLKRMIRKLSKNGTKACYALKMDIYRFFDSIDHQILKKLIRKTIDDSRALVLIDTIIDSFYSAPGLGMPLGNATSQLFANIYLHELDIFIKHVLREKHYLRYCDDFLILSNNCSHLQSLINPISRFLNNKLQLAPHPQKLEIRSLKQGIDFIGYIHFAKYQLLRTKTKRRIKKKLKTAYKHLLEEKIERKTLDQKLHSYLGILSHANEYTLSTALKNAYWVR